MKTTIDIPETELSNALCFTRAKTRREAVAAAIAELAGYAGTCPDLMSVDELRKQRRRRVESIGSD